MIFNSYSVKDTSIFAKNLARFLRKGDVVGFVGDLGAGKTTFIKGLAEGLGVKKSVTSPTFVILRIYEAKKKLWLYHFDLYRLDYLKQLEDTSYEDFVSGPGVCVIEWADRAKGLLPKEYLQVKMGVTGECARKITVVGYGKRYKEIVKKL